jgi:hypothetical protein
MKRDPDIVRELLLALEARQANGGSVRSLQGHSDADVWYHLKLMKEAGLIEAQISTTKATGYVPRVTAYWLTWGGHEFLDATRSKKAWAATRVNARAARQFVKRIA